MNPNTAQAWSIDTAAGGLSRTKTPAAPQVPNASPGEGIQDSKWLGVILFVVFTWWNSFQVPSPHEGSSKTLKASRKFCKTELFSRRLFEDTVQGCQALSGGWGSPGLPVDFSAARIRVPGGMGSLGGRGGLLVPLAPSSLSGVGNHACSLEDATV